MPTKVQRTLVSMAGAVVLGAVSIGCPSISAQGSSALQIRLNVPDSNPDGAFVEVIGLSADDLLRLRQAKLSNDAWPTLLRVSVQGQFQNEPPMLGSYEASKTLRFKPQFPFEAGRRYTVRFDPSKLPFSSNLHKNQHPIVSVVGRFLPEAIPSTEVAAIYPSGEIIPQNELRMYIQFTAPMSRQGGIEYIHLLDDSGKESDGAFLPLQTNLWDQSGTRFTCLFDPGRVKKDLLPRREMGLVLQTGRHYTLVIDSAWPDAQGVPLKKDFRRTFLIVPPIEEPLDPATWRITPPRPGTHDPLSVDFPKPLDHALLSRALGIENDRGEAVEGKIGIAVGETRWLFTPREPWSAGDYQLVALSILEDVAGNRIGRAFDVATTEAHDSGSARDRTTRPFRIGVASEP
jgi:hypothetical protein